MLREICRPIAPEALASTEIVQLVADLRDALRGMKGCGLAAPQLGRAVRMIVVEDRLDYIVNIPPHIVAEIQREAITFHVLVNPTLTVEDSTQAEWFEGCISVPGLMAAVPRALGVRVDALDEGGQPVTIHARSWYARILQHEIDHLDGRLYTDRMFPWSLTTIDNRRRFWADRRPSEMLAQLGQQAAAMEGTRP